MNILLIANSKYIQYIYVFLQSLFDNNPSDIDIYLIHADISDEDLAQVEKFISHWDNKNLTPIRYDLDFAKDFHYSESLPKEVYYRLLCAEILPQNIDKILSLDLDMIITKSIDSLYNIDISAYPLAACKDIYGYIFGEAQRNLDRFRLPQPLTYFNAGTMLLNLKYLRENECSKKLTEFANENSKNLKYLEQDVLNCFFVDKYLEIPWYLYNLTPVRYIMNVENAQKGILVPLYQQEINNLPSFDNYADFSIALRDNAAIIHYIGETKPWLASRPQSQTYQIFDTCYNQYKNISTI